MQIDLGEVDFSSFVRTEQKVDEPVKRDVPANLVKLAQETWDERKWITLTFRGQTAEFVTAFAETMKQAGQHTTPETTVLVQHEENSIIVKFRATQKRGRKPGKQGENGQDAEK